METSDRHKDYTSLMIRYLSEELGETEKEHFEALLLEDPALRARLEEFRKVWEGTGSLDSGRSRARYDMDTEWELLKGKLAGFEEAPPDSSVNQKGRGRIRMLSAQTYRIAAALLAGVIFVFAWLYATRWAGVETVVALNSPVELTLPDGTKVALNRESRLRFQQKMDQEGERRVRLTGEAWFEVNPDHGRPFRIEAGDALVEVLGTSFNVNAYRENRRVEITVSSGVVSLSHRKQHKDQIILKAGNTGIYSGENRELTLIPSADPNDLAWKTRELYFEGASLGEVVALINEVYNTELVIVNPELRSCPITVTFMDQSLEAVLAVLEATLDLEVTRSGGQFLIDGEGCVE